jgi:hypothetical protein
MTAYPRSAGCFARVCSTSIVEMFSPPEMMMSFLRPPPGHCPRDLGVHVVPCCRTAHSPGCQDIHASLQMHDQRPVLWWRLMSATGEPSGFACMQPQPREGLCTTSAMPRTRRRCLRFARKIASEMRNGVNGTRASPWGQILWTLLMPVNASHATSIESLFDRNNSFKIEKQFIGYFNHEPDIMSINGTGTYAARGPDSISLFSRLKRGTFQCERILKQ